MDLSIVSGTWNRLELLQNMVMSAREPLQHIEGFQYEFVIVDGGSHDGTIEWCKSQSDIKLIQHGELRGAVKAFNDGAYASSGKYVILSNDDITFLGNSTWFAYLYMQEHDDCGIGCFYQDRDRQHLPDNDPAKWYVEGMPVVVDNTQAHQPYGQVCIVLKWLGDRVGWWGDYLHTYGGDNELSSQVYTFGYKISPVPETRIHDHTPDDALRSINNIKGAKDPKAVRGHHPDSWAWGRKWRNNTTGLVGATVKDIPIVDNPIETRNRIVYLPIYEQGWDIQKKQKRGLREALSKNNIVVEIDYLGLESEYGKDEMLRRIRETCARIKPNLILTQIHNEGTITAANIDDFRIHNPQAKFVNWNGDYWPDNLISEEGYRLAKAFDLATVINLDVLNKYLANGINADYWQIGWEPDGVGHNGGPNHDVVFLANGYSSERKAFIKQVRNIPNLNFGLYGQSWPDGWSSGQTLYDFKEGCKIYSSAKISLGDSQWPESGFVSNRIFQALAAGGSVLAHQWFKGMDDLGLIDGETLIVWKTFTDLKYKIKYYLSHENERKQIADSGQQLALEHHSFDARVSELFQMIDLYAPIEDDFNWR